MPPPLELLLELDELLELELLDELLELLDELLELDDEELVVGGVPPPLKATSIQP